LSEFVEKKNLIGEFKPQYAINSGRFTEKARTLKVKLVTGLYNKALFFPLGKKG
jgi:hypothetical protein